MVTVADFANLQLFLFRKSFMATLYIQTGLAVILAIVLQPISLLVFGGFSKDGLRSHILNF